MNSSCGDNVDKTVGKVWICNKSVTIASGFNRIVIIYKLSGRVFICPYTAKAATVNGRRQRTCRPGARQSKRC